MGRLSNTTATGWFIPAAEMDCPDNDLSFCSQLHHPQQYLHTATILGDTRTGLLLPVNFTAHLNETIDHSGAPSTKQPIWLCENFLFNHRSLVFKLSVSVLILFLFAYCQSPDTHRKETKCLPGKNPSKTCHLRHPSHSSLCIQETFVGMSTIETSVNFPHHKVFFVLF